MFMSSFVHVCHIQHTDVIAAMLFETIINQRSNVVTHFTRMQKLITLRFTELESNVFHVYIL